LRNDVPEGRRGAGKEGRKVAIRRFKFVGERLQSGAAPGTNHLDQLNDHPRSGLALPVIQPHHARRVSQAIAALSSVEESPGSKGEVPGNTWGA